MVQTPQIIETPELSEDFSDDELEIQAKEWIEFELGVSPEMSIENPFAFNDLEANSAIIRRI